MVDAREIDGEVWRPVDGFPGYEVSNLGRTRCVAAWAKRPWVPSSHPRRSARIGYPMAHVRRRLPSGILSGYSIPVHILVARAFIGPRPVGLEIDHVNGNRLDPRASNLEYVTHAENMRRAVAMRRARIAIPAVRT